MIIKFQRTMSSKPEIIYSGDDKTMQRLTIVRLTRAIMKRRCMDKWGTLEYTHDDTKTTIEAISTKGNTVAMITIDP